LETTRSIDGKSVFKPWHVDDTAHDFQHWKQGLHHFARRIFQPAPTP
jgi:hypothetical protein